MGLGTLLAGYAYLVMDGHWYRLDAGKPLVYHPDVRALIVEGSTRNCPQPGDGGAVPEHVLYYGPELHAAPVSGSIRITRKRNFLVAEVDSGYALACDGEVGEPIFGGNFERG